MQKVLIIDDEKTTLTMFNLFMRAYGYDVFIAEDGKTGLDTMEREKPGIVFTDLKMPDMDGFEVLRRIKKTAPDTEVVVITGFGDMDKVLQALNLEATDFLNKPISRSALDAALNRAEERLRRPPPRECRLSHSRQDNVDIWHIEGRLGPSCRASMSRVTEAAEISRPVGVVLDFDLGISIDGAGIALLSRLMADLQARKFPVTICGLTENFQTIFEMIGITKTACIYDSLSGAVSGLVEPC